MNATYFLVNLSKYCVNKSSFKWCYFSITNILLFCVKILIGFYFYIFTFILSFIVVFLYVMYFISVSVYFTTKNNLLWFWF